MSITISADDLRTIRALEIAAAADQWLPCTTDHGEQAYSIPSQSDPERRYLVTAWWCTCPDFQRGGLLTPQPADEAVAARACKHILAVRLFNELVRAQHNLSRPSGQMRRAP